MTDNDPVAWAVFCGDSRYCYDHYDDQCEAQAIADMLAGDDRGDGLWHIVPLYRSPTLTDAEREAVKWAIVAADLEKTETAGEFSAFVAERAATLRAMLERLT
jgi:hypothetical protein